MKKTIYISVAMLAASMSLLTSCQESFEDVADNNRVYGNVEERVVLSLLDGKADVVNRNLTVKMAQPAETDVSVTYAVYADGVKAYNDIYGENAVMLPSANYSITETVARIPVGKVESSDFAVEFTGLLSLDDTQLYVLPVKIVSSSVPVIESDAVTYFVFRGAALINVVGGLKNTCLTFVNEGQCPMLGKLTQLTFEALINPEAFDNQLSTLMGIEGRFLIRIGDAGVPSNQIQLATSSGNVTDPAWQLEIGKWTFVTLTFDSETGEVNVYFDGVKKGSTQTSGYRSAVNWDVKSSDRACYLGYAYDTDRDFEGKISQVRVWNRVLSASDLKTHNHFYRVATDAEGLVSYWKFDEGSGSLVHDYANGYDLQTPATYPGKSSKPDPLQWYPITLPEK